MLEVKTLRTFALNAKNLGHAEKFYTQVLRGEVVRRIEPTDEQLKRGRVKEVDVQVGNVQVHLFDASEGPRSGVPHHTIMVPWRDKAEVLKELERGGTKVESTRDHGDDKSYSLYVKDPDGNLWELWLAA
jgi:catechol-2,3-dioxygenase